MFGIDEHILVGVEFGPQAVLFLLVGLLAFQPYTILGWYTYKKDLLLHFENKSYNMVCGFHLYVQQQMTA